MSLKIRWARTFSIAVGFTLLVAGTVPATASALGTRKASTANSAKPKVGQARGRTLIFGGGDSDDIGLGIKPTEPITNLENALTNAGYGVDVSSTLPTNLMQYQAIWYIDTSPLSASQENEVEAFVKAGRGLYLTGESDECCGPLNTADTAVINALLIGGGVQAGGLGEADSPNAPNAVTSNAIDDVTVNPNVLTSWTPSGPGGMSGVSGSNVLTSTDFSGQTTPTGAVWDGTDIAGGNGRLAILMDINWLETEFWDQSTATAMIVNLERFLMGAIPPRPGTNAQWAGYAAKAHGVQDVNGAWTVPTVDCTQATKPSAVGIWVGIDGFGNNKLVKAGVGVTCASPTATPCYYLYTEVLPGAENQISPGCGEVSPGNAISVDVANTPFGSSSFVVTIDVNGSPLGSPITLTAPSKRDKSAECIVQLPPKSETTPILYSQLADFGSVTFTSCQSTASQNAGNALDVDQLATGSDGAFAVTALNMGTARLTKATTVAPVLPNLTWSVAWQGTGAGGRRLNRNH